MNHHKIKLFVMHDCHICPQMEAVFKSLHQKGAISELEVIDLGENPDLAQHYKIRSVPHYFIRDLAFNGLRTEAEVIQLLSLDETDKWLEFISSGLSAGQIELVEKNVRENSTLRDAMMTLLNNIETPLVVRIGLSAIIESLTEDGLLDNYEHSFVKLTQHSDERIAIDGIYYLSLLTSQSSLTALNDIAENGPKNLQNHAVEVLQDLSS